MTKRADHRPREVVAPPVRAVPPMTTARIASSSIHSPALLPSALLTFDADQEPGDPGAERRRTRTPARSGCGPDAGQAARLGVAADRLHQHPERGPLGGRPDGDVGDGRDEHRDRQG